MKKVKVLLILLIAVSLFACNNNGERKVTTGIVKNTKSAKKGAKPYERPQIMFKETTYNFGKIIQGEKIEHTFHFTNAGRADLVLSKVSTSCGCTATHYPHYPIKPGDSAKIDVVFDSHNKKGVQNKTITVLTNTQPNHTMLFLKGMVVVPENK